MSTNVASSAKAKPVILWCRKLRFTCFEIPSTNIDPSDPRSCSSALVRSFREHPNIKVAHEPWIPILGSSNLDTIYADRIPYDLEWRNTTRLEVAALLADNKLPEIRDGVLQGDLDDQKIVFIKEMAQAAFSGEAMVAIRPESTFKAPEGALEYQVPDPVDSTPGNPTVFPVSLLRKFTHTFLIRDPGVSNLVNKSPDHEATMNP